MYPFLFIKHFTFNPDVRGGEGVSAFGRSRTHGGGGSENANFRRTSFMDGPLDILPLNIKNLQISKNAKNRNNRNH